MAADGTIRIDSKIDSKGFNSGIKSMLGAVRNIGLAIGVAFGVGAIANFAKSAVQEASSVAEQFNKFNVVFKEFSSGVYNELETFAKATNRSVNSLIGFASTMQDTFVPLGIARGQAAGLSVEVVKLATDLSSFNDIPTADVVRDIQSALVGNFETMRKYGVVLNETTVKAKAQELGLYSGTGAISAQARALAALKLAEEGNVDAMGDATRTAGSFANQIRGMQGALLDLRIAAGNAFIPIIQKILPFIRAAVDAVTAFFNRVAQIVSILFGVQLGAGAAATASALGGTADAANNAADAQDNLGNATQSAAKKAKGALATFDQLNVLQQQNADNAGGAGAGGVPDLGGAGLDVPALDTTQFDSSIDDMRDRVQKFRDDFISFTQPVREAFGRLVEALKPLGQTIWAGLQWAWENILQPLGEWAVTSLVPAVFDLIAGAVTLFNDVLVGLQPTAQWLWDNFLQPLAEWTGAIFVKALQTIADHMQDMHKWIEENQKAWQIILAVLAVVGVVILAIVAPGLLLVAVLAALALGVIALIAYWDELGAKFNEIKDSMIATGKAIQDKISGVFSSIKDAARNAINEIIRIINGMIAGIANSFNIFSGISGAFGISLPTFAAPQIPYLASGAVIPPNAQFAAILGDQKNGKNLEAPESLIRQIFQEELARLKLDVNLTVDGSSGDLARIIKPKLDRENTRIGTSLARSMPA